VKKYQSQQTVQNDFQNYARTESSRNYTGSYLSVFLNKENTVGSRYLFDRWVKGKIVSLQDVVISNDSFLFNYDKVSRILIATPDKQNIIEINLNVVKSFTLTDSDEEMVFEKMPMINDRDFFIGLVKNKDKYSLYKMVKTKFEKANYTTNGIFESGKKYDEFIDEFEYYIVFPGEKEFKKIGLKRKSIKEVLVKEEKKVKEYFSNGNEAATIDESFLKGLITFLNQ
jgi:hypothetical protein